MRDIFSLAGILFFTVLNMAYTLPAPVPVNDHQARLIEEWDVQFNEFQVFINDWSADGIMGYNRLSKFAYDQQSLIFQSDRGPVDVITHRTRALLDHLQSRVTGGVLDALAAQFALLEQQAASNPSSQDLFRQIAAVRRQIMLKNPLLDFNDVFYVQHQTGFHHMIDQYRAHDEWGSGPPAGHGGLYLLKDAFTDNPSRVKITEGLVIPDGRMKGLRIDDGNCMSPDLSVDGTKIVFAWSPSESQLGLIPPLPDTLPDWAAPKKSWGRYWNIFSMNADGTGLQQLTDGPHNSFDPIWLADGSRIVFISEQRGGYGRCHSGPGPNEPFNPNSSYRMTYTMFSMKPDGSDVYPISWHETNEWHPSLNNDGMLVYSRWDYVDRDSEIAHHMWLSYPDGRDPRAPHGNYPHPIFENDPYRNFWDHVDGRYYDRPNMEMNIRSIPGTGASYVATAAPHHGQAFGSLIIIDLSRPDDGNMSQIKKLTPMYPFPETNEKCPAENPECCKLLDPCKPHNYSNRRWGTAWPLSEDYFMVNYRQGIHILDRFGNRVLLTKATSTQSGESNFYAFRPIDPVPFRPRKYPPPAYPMATNQGEDADSNALKATISVMNTYISDVAWPNDGRVPTWMRIVQVIPKTTPGFGKPAIGNCSWGLARMSLGVVPIESDGSVYAEAPVGVEIYFQVLDQRGLAITSMRSGTYVHPGEQMTCVGCHENKYEVIPPQPNPIAMRRAPSPLTSEVPDDVQIPFSYARLVKPVMQAKCTGCHGASDIEFEHMQNYGFCYKNTIGGICKGDGTFDEKGYSRVTPGRFGAYASRLLDQLDNGSCAAANLSDEEFRRITLWLDLNSNQYGAYYDTDRADAGEKVWPRVDVDPANPHALDVGRVPSGVGNKPNLKNDFNPVRWLTISGNRIDIALQPSQQAEVAIYNLAGHRVFHETVNGGSRILIPKGLNGMFVVEAAIQSTAIVERRTAALMPW